MNHAHCRSLTTGPTPRPAARVAVGARQGHHLAWRFLPGRIPRTSFRTWMFANWTGSPGLIAGHEVFVRAGMRSFRLAQLGLQVEEGDVFRICLFSRGPAGMHRDRDRATRTGPLGTVPPGPGHRHQATSTGGPWGRATWTGPQHYNTSRVFVNSNSK